MPPAATLHLQIEQFLESRFPSALTPAPRTLREVASTGISEVDALLQGGLPVGAISEIAGATSSGRTSLALSFLAQRTAESRVCAWVDANDALDPESAAANGVALQQLLWVRCREKAVKADRTNAHLWTRLDQALRATDLLLQAGGFAAIVLDLGDTAREHANRIPLATWFRFRQAADRTRATLLVLGQAAYAQSSTAVVLDCDPLAAHIAGDSVLRGFTAQIPRARERFTPVDIGARKLGSPTTGFSRWGGKPPVSTWTADAPWEPARGTEKRA